MNILNIIYVYLLNILPYITITIRELDSNAIIHRGIVPSYSLVSSSLRLRLKKTYSKYQKLAKRNRGDPATFEQLSKA